MAATDAYLRRVFPADAVDAVIDRAPLSAPVVVADLVDRRLALADALAELDPSSVKRLLVALAPATPPA